MTRPIMGALIITAALAACGQGAKPAVSHPAEGHKVISVSLASSNVYFIETDRGYLMVDTGMAARESAVEELFSSAGLKPSEVAMIIVTHVHPDHVAGLHSAKKLTGAKVLCHRSAARYVESGESEPIVAHSALGAVIAAITPKRFRGVVPDILVENEFELNDYGLAGTIMHTPGHTAGSISIVLSTGETLVGDQVRGGNAELSLGQFYEDKDELLRNLESVTSSEPRVIYMSHGTQTGIQNLAGFVEEQK